MTDKVEHPSHYNNHPSGVECIEVTEHLSFNLGNAYKYIFRCREKGRPIEDLSKAIFYARRELTRGYVLRMEGWEDADDIVPARIRRVSEYEANRHIAEALQLIGYAGYSLTAIEDLKLAVWHIEQEIVRLEKETYET